MTHLWSSHQGKQACTRLEACFPWSISVHTAMFQSQMNHARDSVVVCMILYKKASYCVGIIIRTKHHSELEPVLFQAKFGQL